jgi:uncharacterized protein (DUF4213/DUF364 family)
MPSGEQTARAGVAARIVACLSASAMENLVADVRIGLGYTAVLLADGQLGVAYTFRDEARGGCTVFNGIRPLAPRPASDLLVLLESPDPIEAGVGLACANALANRAAGPFLDGDILGRLDIGPEDHVGMVGHFRPLVSKIRERACSLTVFERVARPSGILRPAEEAGEKLPHYQVALITATSIINHTIDGLLKAAKGCREVVLLGASTPLVPEVFSAEKVDMLSGVVVQDPPAVMQVVSEGGGMQMFSPHVRKVSLRTIDSKHSQRGEVVK